MIRDTATFPKRPTVFNPPFSFPDGKEGKLKLYNVELDGEQAAMVKGLHDMCQYRLSLPLPPLDAPLAAYAEIHAMDKAIAELAQHAPSALQALIGEQADIVLKGEARQAKAVWQSFLLSNPIKQ